MGFQFVTTDGGLRVVLQGSVDLAESQKLKDGFESEMAADIRNVSIQADFLEYIDSSGIAAFLFMKKLCARNGAVFQIATISSAGARVIQLARLDSVLGMRPDAVVAAVGASPEPAVSHDRGFDETAARGALGAAASPMPAASASTVQPDPGLTIQPGSFS